MDDEELVAAVRAVERHGWSPAPIDMVADAARWRGAGLESELTRLVASGRLTLHKQPDHYPSYTSHT